MSVGGLFGEVECLPKPQSHVERLPLLDRDTTPNEYNEAPLEKCK